MTFASAGQFFTFQFSIGVGCGIFKTLSPSVSIHPPLPFYSLINDSLLICAPHSQQKNVPLAFSE